MRQSPTKKQTSHDSRMMQNDDIEIQFLLEAIFLKYGYDFRNYSKASLKRRIVHRLSKDGLNNISEMLYRVLYEQNFFETLLLDLTINVTEMFRDPLFFLELRKKVIPTLATYPFIRVWVAGCSTGEEVYSLAILLKEEGLYERSQIYATDINEAVLKKAKDGIYPIKKMKEYTQNYQKAGGQGSFANYYTARYGSAIMDQALKKNVVFAAHNLSTDSMFNEMHLITCRNVLIYFNKTLQNRVYQIFRESLCHRGFLCLGTKESLQFSTSSEDFAEIVKREKIYRKD